MPREIKPITIDGVAYYTSVDFAVLTQRSENAVYRLISKGNCIRRLYAEYKKFGKPMVRASELTEFPFTSPGRFAARRIYHFDEEGNPYTCETCNIEGVGHCKATKRRK